MTSLSSRSWKRLDYLVHRWTAIVLGFLVFSWFVSGIALMYYPWPALTESRQLALLEPLDLGPSDSALIGFAAAVARAHDPRVTGARHLRRNGVVMYELQRDERGYLTPAALVDAHTGAVLTPLDSAAAIAAARRLAGGNAPVARVDLLPRGDRYMMSREYARFFPAYRVRFADPRATAVYVSRDRGTAFGVATRRTRVTTWIGVVPHWLYFQWLYDRFALWTWLNLVLPSAAVLIAATGIAFGIAQLAPRQRKGLWRFTEYRGISKWHHVAGIVCGVLVLTWTLSGVFEMLGAGNEARAGDAERVRAGRIAWADLRVRERDVVRRLPQTQTVIAIDLERFMGRVGYHVVTDGHRNDAWIDATSGALRGELDAAWAADAARQIVSGARVIRIDRIARYDTYYYARPGREMHLPVWRVAFGDSARSVVYLNTVSGAPAGFVDADTRAWRWLRDGMHSLDFPAINNRRPLWDAIVLPFMIGGILIATTGMWMVVRRVRRMASAS